MKEKEVKNNKIEEKSKIPVFTNKWQEKRYKRFMANRERINE